MTPQFVLPKAKDRWLSAETWCDAILFPRPRLKSGTVPTLGGTSGRIVSPPGSPVDPILAGSTGIREPGVASRVLARHLQRTRAKSMFFRSVQVKRMFFFRWVHLYTTWA